MESVPENGSLELMTQVKEEPCSSFDMDFGNVSGSQGIIEPFITPGSSNNVIGEILQNGSQNILKNVEPQTLCLTSSILSSSQESFKCKYCGQTLKKLLSLRRHEEAHRNGTIYKCRFCDYHSLSRSFMEGHESKHTGNKPYKCDYCEHRVRYMVDLRKHQRVHFSTRKYKCHLCPFRSKWRAGIDKHLLTHSSVRAFSCHLCDAQFKRKSGLTTHLTVHSTNKPFKCDKCDYTCRIRSMLLMHSRSHSDVRSYPCTFPGCTQRCKTKSDLTKHSKVHAETYDFVCPKCGKAFKTRHSLSCHIQRHAEKEIDFTCPVCNRKVSTKIGLRKHLITHFAEKRHTCHICGHKFHSPGNMRTHMKVHSDDRNFGCPICIYSGKDLSVLLTHIGSLHGQEYTYFCEDCRKPFSRVQMIKNHVQRCHKESIAQGNCEFVYNQDCCKQRLECNSKSSFLRQSISEQNLNNNFHNTHMDESLIGQSDLKIEVNVQKDASYVQRSSEGQTSAVNDKESTLGADRTADNSRAVETSHVDNGVHDTVTTIPQNDVQSEIQIGDSENGASEIQIGDSENGGASRKSLVIKLKKLPDDDKWQNIAATDPSNVSLETCSAHQQIGPPKVIKIGSIGNIGVCLASRDSGIKFNYEKRGKKTNKWFMRPEYMPQKDAEKMTRYLYKKNLLEHSQRKQKSSMSMQNVGSYQAGVDGTVEMSLKRHKKRKHRKLSAGSKNTCGGRALIHRSTEMVCQAERRNQNNPPLVNFDVRVKCERLSLNEFGNETRMDNPGNSLHSGAQLPNGLADQNMLPVLPSDVRIKCERLSGDETSEVSMRNKKRNSSEGRNGSDSFNEKGQFVSKPNTFDRMTPRSKYVRKKELEKNASLASFSVNDGNVQRKQFKKKSRNTMNNVMKEKRDQAVVEETHFVEDIIDSPIKVIWKTLRNVDEKDNSSPIMSRRNNQTWSSSADTRDKKVIENTIDEKPKWLKPDAILFDKSVNHWLSSYSTPCSVNMTDITRVLKSSGSDVNLSECVHLKDLPDNLHSASKDKGNNHPDTSSHTITLDEFEEEYRRKKKLVAKVNVIEQLSGSLPKNNANTEETITKDSSLMVEKIPASAPGHSPRKPTNQARQLKGSDINTSLSMAVKRKIQYSEDNRHKKKKCEGKHKNKNLKGVRFKHKSCEGIAYKDQKFAGIPRENHNSEDTGCKKQTSENIKHPKQYSKVVCSNNQNSKNIGHKDQNSEVIGLKKQNSANIERKKQRSKVNGRTSKKYQVIEHKNQTSEGAGHKNQNSEVTGHKNTNSEDVTHEKQNSIDIGHKNKNCEDVGHKTQNSKSAAGPKKKNPKIIICRDKKSGIIKCKNQNSEDIKNKRKNSEFLGHKNPNSEHIGYKDQNSEGVECKNRNPEDGYENNQNSGPSHCQNLNTETQISSCNSQVSGRSKKSKMTKCDEKTKVNKKSTKESSKCKLSLAEGGFGKESRKAVTKMPGKPKKMIVKLGFNKKLKNSNLSANEVVDLWKMAFESLLDDASVNLCENRQLSPPGKSFDSPMSQIIKSSHLFNTDLTTEENPDKIDSAKVESNKVIVNETEKNQAVSLSIFESHAPVVKSESDFNSFSDNSIEKSQDSVPSQVDEISQISSQARLTVSDSDRNLALGCDLVSLSENIEQDGTSLFSQHSGNTIEITHEYTKREDECGNAGNMHHTVESCSTVTCDDGILTISEGQDFRGDEKDANLRKLADSNNKDENTDDCFFFHSNEISGGSTSSSQPQYSIDNFHTVPNFLCINDLCEREENKDTGESFSDDKQITSGDCQGKEVSSNEINFLHSKNIETSLMSSSTATHSEDGLAKEVQDILPDAMPKNEFPNMLGHGDDFQKETVPLCFDVERQPELQILCKEEIEDNDLSLHCLERNFQKDSHGEDISENLSTLNKSPNIPQSLKSGPTCSLSQARKIRCAHSLSDFLEYNQKVLYKLFPACRSPLTFRYLKSYLHKWKCLPLPNKFTICENGMIYKKHFTEFMENYSKSIEFPDIFKNTRNIHVESEFDGSEMAKSIPGLKIPRAKKRSASTKGREGKKKRKKIKSARSSPKSSTVDLSLSEQNADIESSPAYGTSFEVIAEVHENPGHCFLNKYNKEENVSSGFYIIGLKEDNEEITNITNMSFQSDVENSEIEYKPTNLGVCLQDDETLDNFDPGSFPELMYSDSLPVKNSSPHLPDELSELYHQQCSSTSSAQMDLDEGLSGNLTSSNDVPAVPIVQLDSQALPPSDDIYPFLG